MKSINLNEDTSSFKRILETFNDLRNVISHAEQLISSNQIRTQKDLNEMTRGLTIHEKTTFLIMYSTPRKFSKEIEEMMKFKTNNK